MSRSALHASHGRRARWIRLTACLSLALTAVALPAATLPAQSVRVVADAAGSRLQVDGRDFLIQGMNWDYFPIGQNYAYSLWTQPDAVIKAALDREMTLLRAMGVNAIRQYVGIPPRWVKYIYETYGIYTVLNHALGRYGTTIKGVYAANTNYADPKVRAALLAEVTALAEEFRGTPGVLMYLLGNENNYGLSWKSAETEALPVGERDAAKARYLYSLVGEAARAMKARDGSHLVAMANGDVQYVDLIAREAKGIDIFGTNMYRGLSFRDAFQVVKDKLGLPMMFTEFGADAFNAKTLREDQRMQARYLLAQWREIYEQTSGKGQVGNAIGGFTFQWSDGWWKTGQESLLDVHNTDASWPADAYSDDYTRGENNMNEEWWGITAKGPADSKGLFPLYPRAAYYALQRVYQLPAYAPTTTPSVIASHFAAIDPTDMELRARGDRAALGADASDKVRVSGLRLNLSSFNTGGTRLATPSVGIVGGTKSPSVTGFDHLESFYATLEAHPVDAVTASLTLNALGNVPENPIDEIYYENRGRTKQVLDISGQPMKLVGNERVKVYRANVSWDARDFSLNGFYRTGHYHWGYEGDFFGLYREANYGPNIDIYNAGAPLGMEFTGKRALNGLKLAFGPELWWGANPALLAKYRRRVLGMDITGVFQNDVARQNSSASSSFAIPIPPTRAATLSVATTSGPLGIELGGIWAGNTKLGQVFQRLSGTAGSEKVLQDRIKNSDTFGAKAKLTFSAGRWNWYAQGAMMGLVTDAGPTATQTFTGWNLKDSGSGNQVNVLTGVTATFGSLQIAPNFLWQKPLVGPMPITAPPPGRPRNIIDDPFAVRYNRETVGAELLLSYDPTPATWMYQWDNDVREDARFAANVGVVFRHQPTTRDAAIGILADGRTTFPFPGAPPARDLWEVKSRIVTAPFRSLRMIANGYVGLGEPNGNDARLIRRMGGDLRLVSGPIKLMGAVKLNDWGPYDYHRDFNLTYPLQLMGDLSYVLGTPQWFDLPETRFGIRGTWRSLDRMSPRYCPGYKNDASGVQVCDPTAPGPDGREWEIRTYLMVGW